MTAAILALVVVMAVFQILMFGGMVELYRQVLQIRMHSGLVDDEKPVEFDEAVSLDELPIPAVVTRDRPGRSAVLVLSDSCATCVDIARGLKGTFSSGAPGLTVLVEARSLQDATDWLSLHGLSYGDDVLYDDDGRIATMLGVSTTPAVVKFEDDKPVAASTIPSPRRLTPLRDWLAGRDADSTVKTR